MRENLRELWQYRSLIQNLVGRELKVRYRGSVLGFLWTFLNPILQMLVFSIVFGVYQRVSIENYSYFMLVGLLPWSWFATSMLTGTSSISDRRDLISKVTFPPQILPMTVILSALANFAIAVPLMFGFGLLRGVDYGWTIVAAPVVAFVQLLLTLGLVYITATINVFFRDVQHILANLMTFWFFLTPVVYSSDQIPANVREIALRANPMAAIIAGYQSIFFYNRWPEWELLAFVAALALLLMIVGSAVIGRWRESFAEAS